MRLAPDDFQTRRLHATRCAETDVPSLRSLDANASVQRTLFGKTYTLDETIERVRKKMAHWATHGFGDWAFRLHSGEFVGIGGLFHNDLEGSDVVMLGYVVDEPYWGRGLGTEIAAAAMSVAFDALRLAEVFAIIEPSNAASRRILEKNGFSFVRDFVYRDEWPSCLFRAAAKGTRVE